MCEVQMSELPDKLIRQIQIRSRSAASLPGYNPENQTTIDDPTQQQPHQRCISCNGTKHLKMRCCVYCGRLNDAVSVPDPIFFKSTIAYHWLLTSLTLHGSEIVENKTERDRSLSDYLNYRVAWSETSVSGQVVEEKLKSSSLSGFPPDNFFFRINNEVPSTGREEVPAYNNLDLFQSGTSLDLNEERTQGWEADFQFADAGNQNHVFSLSDQSTGITADSASFDGSNVLKVDLSGAMDSLFGGAKIINAEQPKDNLAAGTSDWNLDELGTNVSTREPTVILGLDSIVTSEDDYSTSVDYFEDFQWKTDNSHAIEEPKTIKEDSFDEWNSFTGSCNLEEPSGNVENDLRIINASSTENTTYLKENMTINDDSIDEWNDFTGSTSSQNPLKIVQNEFQTNATSITIPVNTTISEEDRAGNDYVWNDFPGSSSIQDPSTIFWNESQTDVAHVTKTTTTEEHETIKNDLFDDWNGFTGSSSLTEPSGNIQIESQTHDTCVTENTTNLAKNEAVNDASDDFTGSNNLQVPSISVENELQTCVTKSTEWSEENRPMDDEWGGFAGSYSIQDPPTNIWNEWQTNDTCGTDNMTLKKDSVDGFNDFTGSSSLQIPSENPENESQEKDSYVTEKKDSFDGFNDFTGSSSLQIPSKNPENESQEKVSHITEKKDSFDGFNDFTGSSSSQIPSENPENESQEKDSHGTESTKAKNDDRIGEWNGFSGSSMQTSVSHASANMVEEDSFDQWNDFTGSSIKVYPENAHTEVQQNDANVPDNTIRPESKEKHDDPNDQSSLQDPSVDFWSQWQTNDPSATEQLTTASSSLQDPSVDFWSQWQTNDPRATEQLTTASSSLQDPSVDFWSRWQTNDPRATEQLTVVKEHKTSNDNERNSFRRTGSLHGSSGNVEIELQINNTRNTENPMKPNENKMVNKEISDEWNCVTSSNNLQDPSTEVWNEWQTNGNLVTENTTTNKEMRISDPFDELNVFTGSSILPDPSANAWNESNDFPISSKVSVENDKFSSNSNSGNIADSFWTQWQVDNTPVLENVTAVMEDRSENDDSLDEWNDFRSAGSLQDSSTNVGNGLRTNDTFVTHSGMTVKEQMVNDDDSFDEWNDFTGSSNVQNSPGSVGNENNKVSIHDTKSAVIDIFSLSVENLRSLQ